MSKKVFIIIVVVALLGLILFLKWPRSTSSATVILNSERFIIDIATNDQEWARGLSGRTSLAADQGMLFLFPSKAPRSFWMKDMNFALDILWLDGDKIVGWEVNVPPPQARTPLISYVSSVPVDKVLELPAGSVARLNLKVGDLIYIKYD
jgi:uncharacterized protein